MLKTIKGHLKFKFLNFKKSIGLNLTDDEIQFLRVAPWINSDGDNTLRTNYTLNNNSIVFDLGGYQGEWADKIFRKYNSKVYIFEPFLAFSKIIKSKFANNPKVEVFEFGLTGGDKTISLYIDENRSSTFIKDGDKRTDIYLKDFKTFISDNQIDTIDLMKINIEGGEYDLLENIIEINFHIKIKNIQVQFHDFIVPNARVRMENIQNSLAKTHELTYQFEFVWENWKIKN